MLKRMRLTDCVLVLLNWNMENWKMNQQSFFHGTYKWTKIINYIYFEVTGYLSSLLAISEAHFCSKSLLFPSLWEINFGSKQPHKFQTSQSVFIVIYLGLDHWIVRADPRIVFRSLASCNFKVHGLALRVVQLCSQIVHRFQTKLDCV